MTEKRFYTEGAEVTEGTEKKSGNLNLSGKLPTLRLLTIHYPLLTFSKKKTGKGAPSAGRMIPGFFTLAFARSLPGALSVPGQSRTLPCLLPANCGSHL